MKSFLTSQPNQPRSWEEGLGPPLRNQPSPTLAEDLRPAKCRSWLAGGLFGNIAWKKQLLALAWLIIFCFVSYGMLSRYVVMAVIVQGRSMLPTLQHGERYLLNRLTYLYRAPHRYELVVIRDPGHDDYAVKRIVAVPGDTIRFKDGEVFVNGTKLEQSFLPPGTKTFCVETNDSLIPVGKDRYFVLGDNRSCSEDSRTYGTIHRSQIVGMLAR